LVVVVRVVVLVPRWTDHSSARHQRDDDGAPQHQGNVEFDVRSAASGDPLAGTRCGRPDRHADAVQGDPGLGLDHRCAERCQQTSPRSGTELTVPLEVQVAAGTRRLDDPQRLSADQDRALDDQPETWVRGGSNGGRDPE
jgi:hypothetical protein